MTKYEIEILNIMRSRGKTATDIALALQVSVNTVRSYIRRHPPEDAVRIGCRRCGKPILQVKGRKAKYFCSDRCRNAWWNATKRLKTAMTLCRKSVTAGSFKQTL